MGEASQAHFAYLLLRVGVAFAFLYPAITSWFEPYTWLGYVPAFARGYVDDLSIAASALCLALIDLGQRRRKLWV